MLYTQNLSYSDVQRAKAPKGRFARIDWAKPLDISPEKYKWDCIVAAAADAATIVSPSEKGRRSQVTRHARAAARAAGPDALAAFEAQHKAERVRNTRAATGRWRHRNVAPSPCERSAAISAGRREQQAAKDAGGSVYATYLAERDARRAAKVAEYRATHPEQTWASDKKHRLRAKLGISKPRKKCVPKLGCQSETTGV